MLCNVAACGFYVQGGTYGAFCFYSWGPSDGMVNHDVFYCFVLLVILT